LDFLSAIECYCCHSNSADAAVDNDDDHDDHDYDGAVVQAYCWI
jgi:hypothetical protein